MLSANGKRQGSGLLFGSFGVRNNKTQGCRLGLSGLLFQIVLGFTPSERPSRAHQSQNDLEQLYSGSFVAIPVLSVAHPCFPDVSHQVEKRHSMDVLTQIRTEIGRFSVRIGECITM